MKPQTFEETYRILLVSPEVAPFAKTGGLADVAGSLPKALATSGNDVRVVLPRYRSISGFTTLGDFPVSVGLRRETAIIRESFIRAKLDGMEQNVPVYFIDNYHYFDRERLYGFPDEAERFAFFCRAALEMLPVINFKPDIIHLNDWQTGPVALLLKDQYRGNPFFANIATVFTIHNLQYQGNFPRECLGLLGLDSSYFTPERIEFYGDISFMKAGLLYADVINTVSKTYSDEIQEPRFGWGMDGVLRSRSRDLYGILNGINYHEFNPATDPRIYKNYSLDNISEKKTNKYELQKELGLPVRDIPVIGMVTRLVGQKGLDLLRDILDELMKLDLQLVILGKGEDYYENSLREAKERYPDKIGLQIGFNVLLAQRIYAGSDMFLMPSQFEPCGLGQLISLRYGTIPIVRATGGLADTVHDYDPLTGVGNGFSFVPYEPESLLSTIRRALETYGRRDDWRRLMETALRQDFSWNRSAVEYMGLYAAARERSGVLADIA